MKERSDWMEGFLWAEEYIQKGVFFEDDEIGLDSLRWELLYSGVHGSVEEEEFVEGVWSYLEHLEERLSEQASLS